jgi:hypothetical protein
MLFLLRLDFALCFVVSILRRFLNRVLLRLAFSSPLSLRFGSPRAGGYNRPVLTARRQKQGGWSQALAGPMVSASGRAAAAAAGNAGPVRMRRVRGASSQFPS